MPIRVKTVADGWHKVNGTPTDCVHLALTGLLEQSPDIVVAGINDGPNLGDDVLYSGTVAAATEGRFLGLPAIALSMDSHNPTHYDTAAVVALRLIELLQNQPLAANIILNVNVPDRPLDQLKGLQSTRLGHRHKAEPVVCSKDPRGNPIYWVGPCGAEADAGPGTDFFAVRDGYASVTPLQVDLTRHQVLDELGVWLQGISL
jgi:5'-nucleotidase